MDRSVTPHAGKTDDMAGSVRDRRRDGAAFRHQRKALVLAAAAFAVLPAARASAEPVCRDIIPTAVDAAVETSAKRPVDPIDLARLRDIGPGDNLPPRTPLLTLSPDGRRVAFQLRRADPAANSHCMAMVVMDIHPGAKPVIVDTGGELIRTHFDLGSLAGFPTGSEEPVTPHWMPDGRTILFLKRERGRTQIWSALADGRGSRQLTRAEDDVESFRIAEDGRTLQYTTRPALGQALAQIEAEGLTGFHFDARFAPMSSFRPFPVAPLPEVRWVLDLGNGAVRQASEQERERLPILQNPYDESWSRRGRTGRLRTWIEDPLAGWAGRPGRLKAETAPGRTVTCESETCASATRPWWTADGRRVRFIAREGPLRERLVLWEWVPGSSEPKRIYETADVLVDCAPTGDALLCLRESSFAPRRLERLDPVTGARTLIFDPNPEFAQLKLGSVERLYWRNAFGFDVFGDLVLPVGYEPGRRYPLVVVQYESRGFLRGGTGDEYPIQAFAGRGFAVLSVERPRYIGLEGPIGPGGELAILEDRRSQLSAVEAGVKMIVERGIADPERIGITGMSGGATTAIHALIHSRLFSAVALSSCCIDTTLPVRVGPSRADSFHKRGYPKLTDEDQRVWDEIALSRNARKIATPILVQASDDELMSALESYTALREVGAPVDMFVFPGEHHWKWQPAHRLAIYRRSLDWFDFWLRDRKTDSPERKDEIAHWESLRKEVQARRP